MSPIFKTPAVPITRQIQAEGVFIDGESQTLAGYSKSKARTTHFQPPVKATHAEKN